MTYVATAARPACWASAVSPCSGPRSREHYSTRGLWRTPYINVTGLPHSPGTTRMHIDDLVTKSLCKTHNELLSPVDQAAIDLNNYLRRFEELREVRSKLTSKPVRSVIFNVQGLLLERWALKTVMNFAVLFRSQNSGWMPSTWLPDVIFGNRSLPDGCGLALCAKVGDQAQPSDEIAFSFGGVREESPQAAIIKLRNGTLRFLLTWDFPLHRMAIKVDDEPYHGGHDAMLHPVQMTDERRRLAIRFDWGANAKRDTVGRKLTARYPSPAR